MTSKVKNDFSEAHFNIISCFFMISIRMVKEIVKIFKKFHFARIRAQNEISFEKKERWMIKNGQIFEKRDVKIFKKIHFARIRAQNEFSFEKKNRCMARPYGRGRGCRRSPDHCLRLRRETCSGKLTLKNDMFLFYFRETLKKIIVRAVNKNL